MPELKRNFLKGRMNKDLDERLVPDGEYRDALNIEVMTTEASDVGAIQTSKGNVNLSKIPGLSLEGTFCVGSIADEKIDKIYWMIDAGSRTDTWSFDSDPSARLVNSNKKDIIAEFDYNTNATEPVLVDIYEVAIPTYNGLNTFPAPGFPLDLVDPSGIQVGMEVSGYEENSGLIYSSVVTDIDGGIALADDITSFLNTSGPNGFIVFSSKRALNFNKDRLITGINIIDDMLFWTDNHTEPKQINITRCKAGSSDFATHTEFLTTNPWSTQVPPTLYNGGRTINSRPIKEEHITVIKESPAVAPTLEMKNTTHVGKVGGNLPSTTFWVWSTNANG